MHAEIAAMLERSPAAIRQLAVRARRHLAENRPLHIADDHVAAIHVVRNPAKRNNVGHRHP